MSQVAEVDETQPGQNQLFLNLKCSQCQRPFNNENVVQFGSSVLHITCFKCSKCGKSIDMTNGSDGILASEDGEPLCGECGYRCALCNKPIVDEAICTDQEMYHSDCFKCSQCGSELENLTFVKYDGKILCTNCKNISESSPVNSVGQQLRSPTNIPPVSSQSQTIPKLNVSSHDNVPQNKEPENQPPSNFQQKPLPPANVPSSTFNSKPHSNGESVRVFPKQASGNNSESMTRTGSNSSINSPVSNHHPYPGISSHINRNRTLAGGLFSASGTIRGSGSSLYSENITNDGHSNSDEMSATNQYSSITQLSQKAFQTAERTIAVLRQKLESETASRQQAESVLEQLQKEIKQLQQKSNANDEKSVSENRKDEMKARAESLRTEIANSQMLKSSLQQEVLQLKANLELLSQQKSQLEAQKLNASSEALSSTSSKRESTTVPPPPPKPSAQNKMESSHKEQIAEYEKEIAELERSRRDIEANVNERASYLEELFLEIDSLQETKAQLVSKIEDWEGKCTQIKTDAFVLLFLKFLANQDLQSDQKIKPMFQQLKELADNIPNWHVTLEQFTDEMNLRKTNRVEDESTLSLNTPAVQLPLNNMNEQKQTASSNELKLKTKIKTMNIFSLKNASTAGSASFLPPNKEKLSAQTIEQVGNVGVPGTAPDAVAQHQQGLLPSLEAISRQKLKDKKSHVFELHSYKKPRECDYCGEKMWGKELKCIVCAYHAHVKCSINVKPNCSAHLTQSIQSNIRGTTTNEIDKPGVRSLQKTRGFPVLGAELSSLVSFEREANLTNRLDNIPLLVSICIQSVEHRGLDFEGIYRKSGSISQVNKIIERFSKGDYPDLVNDLDNYPDISSVTSTMKKFFMDLAEPLFTYSLYELWMACASLPADSQEKLESCKQGIESLPSVNKATLRYLMKHLATIKAHVDVNKMTATNLGVVWGPSLIKSPDPNASLTLVDSGSKIALIEYFINNVDFLFS